MSRLITHPTCAVVYVRRRGGRRLRWKLFIHSYHFNSAAAVREATTMRDAWPHERIWIQKQSALLPGKAFGGRHKRIETP